MKIYKLDNNLYDVRLDIDSIGINNFLSTWIYKDEKFAFLIDPGPAVLLHSLKEAFSRLNINENGLDYILLTHIHIDHAGSIGNLLELFPRAKVVCHPSAVKHLINPEKLWNASLETLGELALQYGNINSVPETNFAIPEDMANTGIIPIETLGHAPHHQSYLFKNYLFAGEVAGTIKSINNKLYMRPATPPIFNYKAWEHSIKTLISMSLKKYHICYAHYGYKYNAHKMLKLAYNQLKSWRKIISKLSINSNFEDFMKKIVIVLDKKDKYFVNFKLLGQSSQEFEKKLLSNAIKGILEDIQANR
jgi:glyoxylase-like metal-dependent hydrolase (beta-lactamase superfamily II)